LSIRRTATTLPYNSVKMPSNVRLGDTVPNFSADTNQGPINFHEWLAGSWGVLFSHPANYTPVCTTELGRMQQLHPEFEKRGCKIAALSIDGAQSHMVKIPANCLVIIHLSTLVLSYRLGSRMSKTTTASTLLTTPSLPTRTVRWPPSME
jgi:hypothetical protein